MEDQYDFTLEESKITYQSETVRYEQAYTANNCPLIDPYKLADIIASVLSEILVETDKIPNPYTTSFHAKSIPSISVRDYLYRLVKCSRCSQECLILALIYVDRITERNKDFLIKSVNIHRLLITGVMLAAKFFDDTFYSNQYYAKVGGISNKEINILEVEFLNYINFNLYVHPILFFKYRARLISQGAQ